MDFEFVIVEVVSHLLFIRLLVHLLSQEMDIQFIPDLGHFVVPLLYLFLELMLERVQILINQRLDSSYNIVFVRQKMR